MFKKRFQPREVAETITAGDCLRRRREEMKISLKEISNELGIKEEYLDNLERGNYKEMPPQVYVRGFIKSYAGLLGIDGGQLTKIYNREMSFSKENETGSQNAKAARVKLRDYLVITPKILTLVASLVVVFVLGYYFLHQINSFNSKPYLFVESPSADEVVKEKDLLIKGKTEEDAILKINGQEISVNNSGDFNQKISLSEGRNLLVIEAKNRFNKSDAKEINIVYEKPPEENSVVTELPADVTATDAAVADASTKTSDTAKTAVPKTGSAGTTKDAGTNSSSVTGSSTNTISGTAKTAKDANSTNAASGTSSVSPASVDKNVKKNATVQGAVSSDGADADLKTKPDATDENAN